MSLEVHVVARSAVCFSAEEMVEAHFVQTGGAREGGKVSADAFGVMICTRHHDGRIPANVCTDASFEVFVAREPWFVVHWDGVHIWRGNCGGKTDV